MNAAVSYLKGLDYSVVQPCMHCGLCQRRLPIRVAHPSTLLAEAHRRAGIRPPTGAHPDAGR